MAKINPYLNFNGNAAEAFHFYQSVFGGEFAAFTRFKDMPPSPESGNMSEEDLEKVMHVSLPIGDGYALMASDVPESSGYPKAQGNNVYLSITAESKEEADHLFQGLSAGGEVEMPMQDTFWNAYFGSFVDKFGIRWMINFDY